jgi:hypothetical protein
MFTSLLIWLFKRTANQKDKGRILNAMLSTVQGVPIHAIISLDEEQKLLINGRPVDVEQAIALKASAGTVLNSPAWKLVRDQTLFLAVRMGVHDALNADQVLAAKMAIWFGHQQEELLRMFAQETGDRELSP